MNPEDEQKDLGKVTFPDLPIGRIENHDVEKLFSKPFDQSLLQAGDVLLFKDLRSQRLLNPILRIKPFSILSVNQQHGHT